MTSANNTYQQFVKLITTHFITPYRAVNTFHLGYKNQSVYAVVGTSRCLFSDKYKTNRVWAECWFLSFEPAGARNQKALEG